MSRPTLSQYEIAQHRFRQELLTERLEEIIPGVGLQPIDSELSLLLEQPEHDNEKLLNFPTRRFAVVDEAVRALAELGMWDDEVRHICSFRHVQTDIYAGSTGWYFGLPSQEHLPSLIRCTEDFQVIDPEGNSMMLWHWAAGQDEEDRAYPFELEHRFIRGWKKEVLTRVFAD